MKTGPQIATVAALMGDPSRANMLTALMGGQALTAGELAREAGVSLQTASFHLGKLEAGGLVLALKQGRHRYVRLSGEEVALAVEALMTLASDRTGRRTRTGPREPELRYARVCYDHLAGDLGVLMYDRLVASGALAAKGEGGVVLTEKGRVQLSGLGVVLGAATDKRPACRNCLDWSVRRHHLAGPAGKAILARLLELGWARRVQGARSLRFSAAGLDGLRHWLGEPDQIQRDPNPSGRPVGPSWPARAPANGLES